MFSILITSNIHMRGFPGGSDGKESACNAGDPGSIPGSGRSPGDGYPLQYSCLENPMDRRAWQATVHGVTKSWTWLSNTFTFFSIFIYRYNLICLIKRCISEKCVVFNGHLSIFIISIALIIWTLIIRMIIQVEFLILGASVH